MTDSFDRNVHCVLGLPFDAVDMSGAVSRVRGATARRQSFVLSTPNVNWVIACLDDVEFRESVIHSDLSIIDGMPLVWIARLLGIPIRERVAGSNLVEELRNGSGDQLSVFFFGGPEGTAEAACRRLALEDGGLTCVGSESPGFGSIEEMSSDDVIRRINESRADMLFVSLGARKGQAWIVRNRRRLSVPVISHLGAVMSFVAGTLVRAPGWMQRVGLEWLWRLKEEPLLWRRYFRDGWVLIGLVLTRVLPHLWFQRFHAPNEAQLSEARAEAHEDGQDCVIRLKGAWNQRNIAALRDSFAKAISFDKNITLEMAEVTYVDSAFLGMVLLLLSHQRRHAKELRVVSIRKAIRRVMKYSCADYIYLRPG